MTVPVLREVTVPLGVFAELRKATVSFIMSVCRQSVGRNVLTL
jgi:hypothetical protein